MGKNRRYDAVVESWKNTLSIDDLHKLRQWIPEEWEQKPRDLDAIFGFLERRPVRFADIVQDLRRILS